MLRPRTRSNLCAYRSLNHSLYPMRYSPRMTRNARAVALCTMIVESLVARDKAGMAGIASLPIPSNAQAAW